MSQNEKTLVILTPGFAANESDTTCIPMQQSFVRVLKKNYPQLNIIILAFQYPYFKKRYKWFDVTVIPFSGRNKGGLSKLLLRRKVKDALKAINNTNTITGLLSFWYGECALAGKKFADRHNIKHFCWIWGQDAKKENKYARHIRLEGNELIAYSDFLRDEFERNHNIRPHKVIPAAIDPGQLSDSVPERDIDILAAGSLIPLKQYDIFIEIAAGIKKQLPGIKTMLIGNGPEKEKLLGLIAKSGLQPAITLTGELSYPEVLQWMQRTKVFLHPSSYEGFSGVCLEALGAGAHVMSFCKAMNREIEHLHIVKTKEEMMQRALNILKDIDTDYSASIPFLMNDSAKAVMKLFS
jgi:glycosyltransferase involved in cell wall biosynthesis